MLSYFSTYSLPELRHLSYRGTNFVSLCRRSLPPGIGTTVTLISASLSFWKCWCWPDRNFLRCKKKMEITGRDVWIIGWLMIKHLPAELLQEMCWPSSRVTIDLAQLTMNFDQRVMFCAFKHFIIDRTSQSAGAGIRTSIFNRCNDANVRTWEVPLVHTSCDVITLPRTRRQWIVCWPLLPSEVLHKARTLYV